MKEHWDQYVTKTPELGYYTISQEVGLLAKREGQEAGNLGKVAAALETWCQINTEEWDGRHDKYRPKWIGPEGRTAAEEDIDTEWLELLLEAQEKAVNPWVVGKLGDLVWRGIAKLPKTAKKRAAEARNRAIQAWLAIDPMIQDCDLEVCWSRAAALAREAKLDELQEAVKQGMQSTLQAVVNTPANQTIERLTGQAAERGLRRCTMNQVERKAIAVMLSQLADRYEQEDDHNWAEGTRGEAIQWAVKAGENGLANEERWKWGEEKIRWAEATHGGAEETPWVLAMLYGDAIEAMAPGASHASGKEERRERLEELRRKQSAYAERSHEGLTEFQTDPIDITKYVRAAQETVQGRSFNEAALILALTAHTPQPGAEYEAAAEQAHEGVVLHALARSVVVNEMGQRIRHEEEPEGLSRMGMEQFTLQAELCVKTAIVPRLQTITEEHGPWPIEWYVSLCEKSAWVPKEHKWSWAKGLKDGMEWAWYESMHILLPRIESCLRHVARQAGILRAARLSGAHETAWWLKQLLVQDRSKQLISEGWRTELLAAACGATGWNLRNDHCHALLTDNAYAGAPSVYTWWLLFHCTASSAYDSTLPLKSWTGRGKRTGD